MFSKTLIKPYPGNVRELEHLLDRAYLLSTNHSIQLEDIPSEIKNIDEKETSYYALLY
jgi:DNA-binding NtrC family response regulator